MYTRFYARLLCNTILQLSSPSSRYGIRIQIVVFDGIIGVYRIRTWYLFLRSLCAI